MTEEKALIILAQLCEGDFNLTEEQTKTRLEAIEVILREYNKSKLILQELNDFCGIYNVYVPTYKIANILRGGNNER